MAYHKALAMIPETEDKPCKARIVLGIDDIPNTIISPNHIGGIRVNHCFQLTMWELWYLPLKIGGGRVVHTFKVSTFEKKQ